MIKIYTFTFTLFVFITTIGGQTISLTGTTYTQDFNTLSNTAGTTTNNLTIPGWFINETGGGARDNEQYAVDAGGSSTGDTYSFGAAATTERALGTLRSGTLIPVFGAAFTNNTGLTITTLNISFTGEQWRLGNTTRNDQLNFEYSTDATDLVTGTWTGVSALNFATPNTATVGAQDGNLAANRSALANTVTGLSIPNGASFWIRWVDTDATSADDGLAVDDFSITPSSGALPLSLTSFAVVKERNSSKLIWTTSQETNSQFFVVERASGSSAWQPITKIAAAGNSNNLLTYSYTDASPLNGVNLYRLRMLDKDNKTTFSDTRRVNFGKDNLYTVYPNPAQDYILLSSDNLVGNSTILQLIDINGETIIQRQVAAGMQPFKVNTETLKPGIYYLRITAVGEKSTVLSFVKR